MSIAFLVFTCGRREYQVLPVKKFMVLNTLKIVCIVLSSIFIALSLLYSVLITIAFNNIRHNGPINLLVGYIIILYYIICVCLFSCEKRLFTLVGSSANPGPFALYNVNGQPMFMATPLSIINPAFNSGQNFVQMQVVPIYANNAFAPNIPNNQNALSINIKQDSDKGNTNDRINVEKPQKKGDNSHKNNLV